MFNPNRLSLARKRRRLTGKGLAELSGLTAVTISRLEKGLHDPEPETLERLASALDYPVAFFEGDDVDEIPTEAISFRSLKAMSAKERAAAVAAGELGLLVSDWVEEHFDLPEADLPDFSRESDPEAAAMAAREYWGLGQRPIASMIRLVESKGVRVFSLTERAPNGKSNVDAYSFWRDDRPFIFLNNFKTPEHSVYDCAHEIAHLILHRHQGPKHARNTEHEADVFASAFLMPRRDVRARLPRRMTTDAIINAKARWRVSAMALAYRLRDIGVLSDWQYRSTCIELSKRGYRSGEPVGIERDHSVIWQKVLANLWAERTTKAEIAQNLNIPLDELESLIFGIATYPGREQVDFDQPKPAQLRIIK